MVSTTAATQPLKAAHSVQRTPSTAYFHKVGTPQDQDELVFRNDNEPNRYHFAGATEDGRYVVFNTSTGTDGNALHVMARRTTLPGPGGRLQAPPVPRARGRSCMSRMTGAPRYRLVAADPASPSPNRGKTCSQNRTTCWSRQMGVVSFGRRTCTMPLTYSRDLDGSNPRVVALPEDVGSAVALWQNDTEELYYAFMSPTSPLIYNGSVGTPHFGASLKWPIPPCLKPSKLPSKAAPSAHVCGIGKD